MTKQIVIEVPDWVDEEKLRRAIIQTLSKVTEDLTIEEEVRKML